MARHPLIWLALLSARAALAAGAAPTPPASSLVTEIRAELLHQWGADRVSVQMEIPDDLLDVGSGDLPRIRCEGGTRARFKASVLARARAALEERVLSAAANELAATVSTLKRGELERRALDGFSPYAFAGEYYVRRHGYRFEHVVVSVHPDSALEGNRAEAYAPGLFSVPSIARAAAARGSDEGFEQCYGAEPSKMELPVRVDLRALEPAIRRIFARRLGGELVVLIRKKYADASTPYSRSLLIHELRHLLDWEARKMDFEWSARSAEQAELGREYDRVLSKEPRFDEGYRAYMRTSGFRRLGEAAAQALRMRIGDPGLGARVRRFVEVQIRLWAIYFQAANERSAYREQLVYIREDAGLELDAALSLMLPMSKQVDIPLSAGRAAKVETIPFYWPEFLRDYFVGLWNLPQER